MDCFVSAIPLCRRAFADVRGPFGETIRASYGVFGQTAVIEMAAAAGLGLCKPPDPLAATTFGVGQIIKDAVAHGCQEIILGLGGSGTNDGGAGMAAALGTRFLDRHGDAFVPVGGTLGEVAAIDNSAAARLMDGVRVRAMCDIDNPMYGENGASYVFAAQKGADGNAIAVLDGNMRKFAQAIRGSMGIDPSGIAGGGAAGALGAGAYVFLGAALEKGIDVALDLIGFDGRLDACRFVFTGEGRLDRQSLSGKAVIGIAERAKAKGVPVIAFVGSVEKGMPDLSRHGIRKVYAASEADALPQLDADGLKAYCAARLAEAVKRMAADYAQGRL